MQRTIIKSVATLMVGLAANAFAQEPNKDTSFLKPPAHIAPPTDEHAATNRAFQGISSMAVSPKGRLWATWYAGVTPGEDKNNYVVLATSGDDGKTWKEVLTVDPDGPGAVRAFDPELWVSPEGKLLLFWAQAIGHDGSVSGTWVSEASDAETESPSWSAPKRIADGIMMCKPTVLSSGEWAAPISRWALEDSAMVVISKDAGRTWNVRGSASVPKEDRTFDEHMLVERKDGSLWMLVRTNYGIGESLSPDRGATWPIVTRSNIVHPAARFFISRLLSGNLLLVKHGPLDKQSGRSHLTAYISTDDGKTWGGGLLLDERDGISYPDGQQTADGKILITYDYDRTGKREVYFATFREEDASAGKVTSQDVRLRQLISKASGGRALTLRDNAEAEPFRNKTPGRWETSGHPSGPLDSAPIFTDRDYTVHASLDELSEATMIRMPMEKTKVIKCAHAGTVYFLTPEADRNKDSQSHALESQGFKKAALPEFTLFTPVTTANSVSVYQKDCAEGEEITFNKWAVPVFLSK